MQRALENAAPVENFASAFEHSITWEDDIWRADPVDVPAVHSQARAKVHRALDSIVSAEGVATPGRLLLFHGQSGAGKTHLIRALRTGAHRAGTAYFGYAQMTPDVASYADYYLRRLVASLEKPYDPDEEAESGLARLTNKLAAAALDDDRLNELTEAKLDEDQLAKLIIALADEIVASPSFAAQELDINIVRALLYLQRADPRIDQRVRQYLQGRPLNELSQSSVSALDPSTDSSANEMSPESSFSSCSSSSSKKFLSGPYNTSTPNRLSSTISGRAMTDFAPCRIAILRIFER
jgi:hypothetical protein